jgi:hypothetical protein
MTGIRLRVIMSLVICLHSISALAQHRSPLDRVVQHGQVSGDLATALAEIAQSIQMPLMAELAQPLPKIQIAPGTHTGEQLLQKVIQQALGYRFDADGPVVHLYDAHLASSQFNFLNLRFQKFVMPKDVSELKYKLPGLAAALLDADSTRGVILTGFGDPELAKLSLQPGTLENVSAREILLLSETENPDFLTIIVFPNDAPTKEEARQATVNWFWHSLKVPLRPLYVQPYAPE